MKKLTKKNKIILSSIALALIVIAIVISVILLNKNKKNPVNNTNKKDDNQSVEVKKVKIVNEDSTSRPFAVMINNISVARPLQSGLQDAYLMYEIIVEGGISRYLALFMDQSTERIGSIRSASHYFLDYALENDAIYVHHGQSPQAQSDFSKLGIERVVVDNSKTGWRDTSLNVSSEHTLFTNIEKLNKGTNKFRKERNKNYLLNYSADEIDMSSLEKSSSANKISLVYSSGTKVYYEYDESNKYYLRSTEIGPHTDYVTKQQYHFKNIIAYQVDNYTINDGENKGRQDIKNIGSGSGYYFSDGYMIPIKWKKDSRSSQTKYTYEDGTELKVNDGNTFIQIVPSSGSIKAE